MTWSAVDARRALEILGKDASPTFERALRHYLTYPSHSAATIVADAFTSLLTDQVQLELRLDMATLEIKERAELADPPDRARPTRLETR